MIETMQAANRNGATNDMNLYLLMMNVLNNIVQRSAIVLGAMALGCASLAFAGKADVVDADIISLGDNRYRVNATVKHADTGWDHYANRWDVLSPDGSVLGVRELAHPHENEQPFTRSLTLTIPAGVEFVTIRANDSVHGLGGAEFLLEVPVSE